VSNRVVAAVTVDSLPEFPPTRHTVAMRTDPSLEVDFLANMYGIDGDRLVYSVILAGPPMKEVVVASIPTETGHTSA